VTERLRESNHGSLRVTATEDKDTVEHRAYKIAEGILRAIRAEAEERAYNIIATNQ
jgi:hypothetical protein